MVYPAHRFALQNLFAPGLNVQQPRLATSYLIRFRDLGRLKSGPRSRISTVSQTTRLWLLLLFPGFSLLWMGADRRFHHSFVRSSTRILSLLRWLAARPGIVFDIAHCRLFRAAYARWTGQERAIMSMMTNKLTGDVKRLSDGLPSKNSRFR